MFKLLNTGGGVLAILEIRAYLKIESYLMSETVQSIYLSRFINIEKAA